MAYPWCHWGGSMRHVIVPHKGKVCREGPFHDEREAAKARDRLARKLHGPFARLNLPPTPRRISDNRWRSAASCEQECRWDQSRVRSAPRIAANWGAVPRLL
jgi:hypothetical protein